MSEYIRRRRLARAPLDLQRGARVTEVALKYSYSSPDAFRRAFVALHGRTPSQARRSGQSLQSYPPLTFQLILQGGEPMKFRIEHHDTFRVVGIQRRVPLVFQGINPAIAEMWQSLDDRLIQRLKAMSNTQPTGVTSASTHFSDQTSEFSQLGHYIGVATTLPAPEELAALEVDAGGWAIFECCGPFPQTMQSIWARIYSEWLPASPYELRQGPQLVWCQHRELADPKFRNDIWIPVRD